VFWVQAARADDHLMSQIEDICRWYATGGPPTAQRQAAALAELAEITAGRTELLARYAGQYLGRAKRRRLVRATFVPHPASGRLHSARWRL
jgi:hypothetical protein